MTLARRRFAVPLVVLLVGGVLAGCVGPAAGSPSSSPTLGDQIADAAIDAAWLDDGRTVAVVTNGSSTCVPSADTATLQPDGSLLVPLVRANSDPACTSDSVPRATLVGVPEGVDPSGDLTIAVTGDGYSGHVELDGVDGLSGWIPVTEESVTDWEPSAGWTQTEGRFVMLTNGSSSCVPVIADVAASGPAEVTVTFETPPAVQNCTADMAQRSAVVSVEGLESDGGITLILAGSPEFGHESIPIYGEN